MKEIRIRGLDSDIVAKLREISSRSYYKSLNQYLVSVLTEIANTDGLLPLEKEVKSRHMGIANQIEKNTEVMTRFIELIERKEKDNA